MINKTQEPNCITINNTPKKRLEYIDCIKGIAILLVVAGHCVSGRLPLELIYMVHLPLFFVVSGYLLNVEDKSLKEIAIHKSKNLLYPYFTMGLLLILYLTAKSIIEGDFTAKMLLKRIIALIWDTIFG